MIAGLLALLFLWLWSRQKRRKTELQIAARSILEGEVQERSRIARDLHDGLGGLLSAAKINMSELKSGAMLAYPDVESLNRIMGLLDESLHELRRVARSTPDVLLLDIGLPDGNGIDACLELQVKYPDMRIMMLTSYSELNVITRSLENGALGYILKNSMVEEIVEGICTVAMGERFLCEEVDLLLRTKKGDEITLSRREGELLKLIAEGYTMNTIADLMHIGYETVKSYRKNIMAKLQVPNTAALVKYAVERKMI